MPHLCHALIYLLETDISKKLANYLQSYAFHNLASKISSLIQTLLVDVIGIIAHIRSTRCQDLGCFSFSTGDMKEKMLTAKQKAAELDTKITERQLTRKEKRRGRRPNPPKCRCAECGFTTNRIREMASHKKLHQLAKNSCIYCDK